LNEDLGAVEKCHFCAHRIEKGLEPACVTVCPVGAIIPGDFHDPESQVSLLKRAQKLKTRRPEQKTGPNVFYIGASEVALQPGVAEKPKQYMWSQRRPTKPEAWPTEVGSDPEAREVLNADHKVEWGWPVALYLLTKGIAGGAAMIAPFFSLFGQSASVPWWAPETIGLVFMLVTVFLLIEDLKKPMHFYKLFTRPNWDSWLVKGGIVLTVFGLLSAAILAIGALHHVNFSDSRPWPGEADGLIQGLRWANLFVGALVAGYTAFLFKQCKGRDLWEEPGLLWHLLAQSVTAGAAFYLLFGTGNWVSIGAFTLGVLTLMVLHSFQERHAEGTSNLQQARGFLKESGFYNVSRVQGLLLIPVFIIFQVVGRVPSSILLLPFAILGLASLALLFLYERAFVRAGQLPPLS
jgi:formate-dependent nitrite reductase membrane component NrfD